MRKEIFRFLVSKRKPASENGVIAKWENGNPRVDTLKKVADFFGCTIDELMKKG